MKGLRGGFRQTSGRGGGSDFGVGQGGVAGWVGLGGDVVVCQVGGAGRMGRCRLV